MNKKVFGGAAAVGALGLLYTLIPGFNPESDLSRSLGSAKNRWAGVYTTHISDGVVTAEVSNIALKSDAGDIDLSGYVKNDDARLADAREPLFHAATHAMEGSDILTPADIGAISENDSRLTDARIPTAHAASHAIGGEDAVTPFTIGAMGTAPETGKSYLAVGDSWVEYTPPEQTEDGTFDHTQLVNRDADNQHPQTAITGLANDLAVIRADVAAKADASALDDYATVVTMAAALASKADIPHAHAVADVTGLQSTLDSKANASSLDDYATISAMTLALSEKADTSTLTNYATSTALSEGLAAKADVSALGDYATTNAVDLALSSKADASTVAAKADAIIGEIRLLPFRKAELPAGWYYPSGDYFALTSVVGAALNLLPANYKSDWGIATSGSTIRLFNPSKFFSGNYGRFFRPVNGSSRNPGSTEDDAIRNITGSITPTVSGYTPISVENASGVFYASDSTSISVPTYSSNRSTANVRINIDASRVVTTAAENRPYNVGMTPAVYLGE